MLIQICGCFLLFCFVLLVCLFGFGGSSRIQSQSLARSSLLLHFAFDEVLAVSIELQFGDHHVGIMDGHFHRTSVCFFSLNVIHKQSILFAVHSHHFGGCLVFEFAGDHFYDIIAMDGQRQTWHSVFLAQLLRQCNAHYVAANM